MVLLLQSAICIYRNSPVRARDLPEKGHFNFVSFVRRKPVISKYIFSFLGLIKKE